MIRKHKNKKKQNKMNLIISMNEIVFIFHVLAQLNLYAVYCLCFVTTKSLHDTCLPEWINIGSHTIMIILSNSFDRRKRTFLICIGRVILHLYFYVDSETVPFGRKYEIRIIILYLEFIYFVMMSLLMLFGNSPAWNYDLSNCWEETTVVILASLYYYIAIFNFEIAEELSIIILINILILTTWKIYDILRPRPVDPNYIQLLIHLRWVTTMTELTLEFMNINLNDNRQ